MPDVNRCDFSELFVYHAVEEYEPKDVKNWLFIQISRYVDFAGRKNFVERDKIILICELIYNDLAKNPRERINQLPFFINALFMGKFKLYGDITSAWITECWQESKNIFNEERKKFFNENINNLLSEWFYRRQNN